MESVQIVNFTRTKAIWRVHFCPLITFLLLTFDASFGYCKFLGSPELA